MDISRSHGRKRYCCYYCNTYFYQVDSWQRHNRKHTSVEIECDDCGFMCSDHLELRSHQNVCDAHRVYAEDVYTQPPLQLLEARNRQTAGGDHATENTSVHETPDSTSKQESLPENESAVDNSSVANPPHEQTMPVLDNDQSEGSPDVDRDLSVNPELEHLIGEDKEGCDQRDEEDPETEALIGIDQSEVNQMKNCNTDDKGSANQRGVDTQIVINVETALNQKQNQSHASKSEGKHLMDVPSFYSQVSPVGSGIMAQSVSLDSSDLNKKYQPYFCKNCGARFTRKDSVTRHLKKGTCSGKSAIVCNICGKVFSEMYELQEHFKVEHKNVVFTPTIVHRSLLPRTETHEAQQPYGPFPTHYIVHDQHMVHVNRPSYHGPEQTYRPMPPGLQTMFYAQSSFGPRAVHPPPTHYHDQLIQPRPMELKFPSGANVGKDMNFINNHGKLALKRSEEYTKAGKFFKNSKDDINRKRDYPDYQDELDPRKNRKIEVEYPTKKFQPSPNYRLEKVSPHDSINLSEYTNNAMSSKQYYNNRFIKNEPSAGKDEPPRAHQCKVCGLEFPRFEYLLTHLRKHKEKNEVEPFDEQQNKVNCKEPSNQDFTAKISSLNDSNSSSSDDNNEYQQRANFVMSSSNFQDKVATIHSSHDGIPIVIPQPHHRYGVHPLSSDRGFLMHGEQSFPSHHSSQCMEGVEAITPGVDGKFRPFICENCGQRFTRKDSLVRHAKKQTCFEEASDLKCKHCDKTFRYHKCLVQHQELVHGIPQPEQKPTDDEHSDSESEKNEHHESRYQHQNLDESSKYQRENPEFLEEKVKYSDNSKSEDEQKSKHSPDLDKYQQHYHGDTHYAPSQHHSSQHQSSTPKIMPPMLQDDKSKGEGGKGSSQDSSYIGYCMLPRPFQCEYCGDRFAHRHSLKRHVRRHLGIGIPCHDCGKLYRDQSEWRRHQRSIHNRHYEKYEVPSRMSFRDGVDQGLIGVVASSEYDANMPADDVSESENEEDAVMKEDQKYLKSPAQNDHDNSPSDTTLPFSSRLSSFGFRTPKVGRSEEAVKPEEKPSIVAKDEKAKAFDFKSHSVGDKDSRKSVLDLYLCSPNSDDGDYEKNNNRQDVDSA